MGVRMTMRVYLLLCAFAFARPFASDANYTNSLNDGVSLDKARSTDKPEPSSPTFSPDDANVVTSNYARRDHVTRSTHSARFNGTTSSPAGYALKESGTEPVGRARRGYERDLMVVLPVMQGDADLSNSNLQMLYTKAPVTAIIGGNSKDLRPEDVRTTAAATTTAARKVLEKRIDRVKSETPLTPSPPPSPPQKRDNDPRHPYTDFLSTKQALKSHKSPLDYGYPESFKFVQELNEMPKNHKPEWASGDPPQTDAERVTSAPATRGDPFQMFESVKPLEINKLLSLRPAPVAVTDSIVEETMTKQRGHESTEPPYRYTKRPANKRPTKKPQKNKLSPQKLSDFDLAEFTSPSPSPSRPTTTTAPPPSTTTKPTAAIPTSTAPSVTAPSAPELDDELYNAARYTTLFSQSTKIFLPTPYTAAAERGNAATVLRPIGTKSVPTSAEVPTTTTAMTTTTTHTTAIAPNFQWANVSVNVTSAESTTAGKVSGDVKPSELVSLTKILGENFVVSDTKDIRFAGMPLLKDLTTQSPFPADMLTNDMKNMLIALGILKSENESSMLELPAPPSTPTSTTNNVLENLFAKREPVTPAIDPNSYVSFKKIPTDYERLKEKQPVSDDMKDLLASFGLLPKKTSDFANSILTRISRQRKFDGGETTPPPPGAGNASELIDLFPESMHGALENVGLLRPQAYNYQPHKNGHVFQPTIQLEQLGDEQKARRINDAIETIRKLSKSKDAENLSIEELERRLENVTALLKDENFADFNESFSLVDVDDANTDRNLTTYPTVSSTLTSTTTSTLRSITRFAAKSTTTSAPKSTTTFAPKSTTTSTPKSTTPFTPRPSTSSTATTTTTEEDDHEFDQYLPVLENSGTSLKHKDINYTSDESVVSFVKFSRNESTEGREPNLAMNPPNPLSPEELQHLLLLNKNDVKRQQPNDTSATEAPSSSESSSDESVDSSTRAMGNNSAPLPDLADSFGGGEAASEQPSTDDLATPKPNGLYFYLDWNTFLNVGEADRNPIRLRFSPRAGNARNFVPITVP